MFLDYFSLFLLIFVVVVLFYGIIAIHDIPYLIACRRNHPHQDAIHVAGWISLFTLHILWPFLWIWATLWREDRGWGFEQLEMEQHDLEHKFTLMTDRINDLESRINAENINAAVEPTDTDSLTPESR
ncbi:MAG: GTPase [marine bacterium B5-7]|nr:MAG: GTPase [marine bacterium B5-7]